MQCPAFSWLDSPGKLAFRPLFMQSGIVDTCKWIHFSFQIFFPVTFFAFFFVVVVVFVVVLKHKSMAQQLQRFPGILLFLFSRVLDAV